MLNFRLGGVVNRHKFKIIKLFLVAEEVVFRSISESSMYYRNEEEVVL